MNEAVQQINMSVARKLRLFSSHDLMLFSSVTLATEEGNVQVHSQCDANVRKGKFILNCRHRRIRPKLMLKLWLFARPA